MFFLRFCALCWAMLFGLFFLPQAQAAEEISKPRIGIFFFKLDDVYVNSVAKVLAKSLRDKVELHIFDAKNDQTLQTEQLSDFLRKKPDALAINLVDIKISQNIINLIHSHNIPVIFFNKEPDEASLLSYNKARYVGTRAAESGFIQGDIIAKLWKEKTQLDRNNDGVCHFIMFQGGLDNPEALLRSRISVQRARDLGVPMQQLGDTLLCDWGADCAYKASKLALDIYEKDVDFIISNNDDMALGALKNLQERGFNLPQNPNTPSSPCVAVVGIDATEKAKEAIAAGTMHGTVVQDAAAMGNTIATMLLNATHNKAWLHNINYPWDESGIAVRIPYQPYTP